MYQAAQATPGHRLMADDIERAMHRRQLSRPDLPPDMAPAWEPAQAEYLRGLLDRHA